MDIATLNQAYVWRLQLLHQQVLMIHQKSVIALKSSARNVLSFVTVLTASDQVIPMVTMNLVSMPAQDMQNAVICWMRIRILNH